MEIKRIYPDDAGQVTGLFDQYRRFYEQPSDIALAEQFIRDRLSNNESVIFIAMDNDIPAGFTQLYPKYSSVRASKNWILNDLYVDVAYRKRGIGEALIKTAMDFAKSQGAAFVQLETAVDNYAAQRLYEAMGFVKQEPETDFLVYVIGV